MPIYEYFCPETNTVYSFYARSLRYAALVPRCPENPAYRMEKVLSSFAVLTGAKAEEPAEPAGDPAEDAHMEQAMAEMEREFGGMDENNPDPRQLAKLMRRMAEATGEAMPGPMQEMMRRLEAGEDPDKLDAEYASELEGLEPGEGAMQEALGKLRKRRAGPRKDPTLYEMSEYVEA